MSNHRARVLLGAHLSIAGGVYRALERAHALGMTAVQIFTKNARSWKAKPLSDDDVALFHARMEAYNLVVAAHDSYLINLAKKEKEGREKTLAAFTHEIERAETLRIPYLVFHPGSAKETASMDEACTLIAEGIDRAIEESESAHATLLLETTAGMKNAVGSTFEEIADIIERSRYTQRLGVCFDTCHAFAAGYDLATEEGYDKTFSRFDEAIGLSRLKFIHVNDALKERGSRLDRHTHIGEGTLGKAFFTRLMNDARFRDVPKCLETPKGDDDGFDKKNLAYLRTLVAD